MLLSANSRTCLLAILIGVVSGALLGSVAITAIYLVSPSATSASERSVEVFVLLVAGFALAGGIYGFGAYRESSSKKEVGQQNE
jgi:hypothetical protein